MSEPVQEYVFIDEDDLTQAVHANESDERVIQRDSNPITDVDIEELIGDEVKPDIELDLDSFVEDDYEEEVK